MSSEAALEAAETLQAAEEAAAEKAAAEKAAAEVNPDVIICTNRRVGKALEP
jgi:ABC-type hemin transport system substrate-binding protein